MKNSPNSSGKNFHILLISLLLISSSLSAQQTKKGAFIKKTGSLYENKLEKEYEQKREKALEDFKKAYDEFQNNKTARKLAASEKEAALNQSKKPGKKELEAYIKSVNEQIGNKESIKTAGRSNMMVPVNENDSLALIEFYNSTQGDNWNYNFDENSRWLEGPVSNWGGVIVEGERVVELNVGATGFGYGTLMPGFSNLTELRVLNLVNFQLSDLGDYYDAGLDSMIIDFNPFEGMNKLEVLGLPSGTFGLISKLQGNTALRELYIPNTGFAWDTANDTLFSTFDFICTEFTQLTKLSLFNAYEYFGNDGGFQIPASIGNLTLLEELITFYTQIGKWNYVDAFETDFPAEFSSLQSLKKLYLDYAQINRLGDFSNMITLDSISLKGNDFDTLPNISSFPSSLLYLDLRENNLGFNELIDAAAFPYETKLVPQSEFYFIQISSEGVQIDNYPNEGIQVTLAVESRGAESYTWYKNGQVIQGPSLDTTYVIANFDTSFDGIYRVEASHSAFPNYIMRTFDNNIEVYNPVFSEADSLRLVAIYNALDGPNWDNQFGWLEEPVTAEWGGSNWSGITIENNRVRSMELSYNGVSGSLPSELSELTYLTSIRLSGNDLTGTLPANIGNLTFLEDLELSQCGLTGALPESFGNLPLRYLDLGRNNFEGPFPENFGSIQPVERFYIYGNKFTYLPAIQFVENQEFESQGYWTGPTIYIEGNKINFAGLSNIIQTLREKYIFDSTMYQQYYGSTYTNKYNYYRWDTFQSAIDDNQQIEANGDVTLSTQISGDGVVYRWFKNGQPFEENTTGQLQLTGNDIYGVYQCLAESPGVPEIPLLSGQFFVQGTATQAAKYTVNNNAAANADFTSLASAVLATNQRDTLYVYGSPTSYEPLLVTGPKVIYGPGYFLQENSLTSHHEHPAHVSGYSIISQIPDLTNDASGTEVYGMSFDSLYVQFTPFSLYRNSSYYDAAFFNNLESLFENYDEETFMADTLSNIVIERNRIHDLSFMRSLKNLRIERNFIDQLKFTGSFFEEYEGESYREDYGSLRDVYIKHNIIEELINWFEFYADEENGDFDAPAETIRYIRDENLFGDAVFEHNVAGRYDLRTEFDASNNIMGIHNAEDNILTDNLIGDFTTGVFENASESFAVDNDYRLATGSPAIGVGTGGVDLGSFGGEAPYVLSGLSPIPFVNSAVQIGSNQFELNLSQKVYGEFPINRVELQYYDGGTLVKTQQSSAFEAGMNVETTIEADLSGLLANTTYDISLKAVDNRGVKSYPVNFTFNAEAYGISGTVNRKDNSPMNNGTVLLFRVNSENAYFDTVAVVNITTEATFTFTDVFAGDYILLAKPNTANFPNTLPTYYPNTIDWQNATVISLTEQTDNLQIVVDQLPDAAPQGNAVVLGTLEEDLENGRLLNRRAISGAGVSIRVASSTVRTRNLRFADDGFELVGYMVTGEDGKFEFRDLERGTYRLRVNLPGVPDEAGSDFEFDLEGADGEEAEFLATVTESGISIERIRYILSNDAENSPRILVYPNPSTGFLTIRSESTGYQNVQVELLDIQGKQQKTWYFAELHQEQIELKGLQTGVYILKVIHEDGSLGIARIVLNN